MAYEHMAIDDMLDVPHDAKYITYRGMDPGKLDLSRVPDTAVSVSLLGQEGITSLDPLMRCRNLKELDCTLCKSLEIESVLRFKREMPSVELNLELCDQLAGKAPGVTSATDRVFLEFLGTIPPRVQHMVPKHVDDEAAWEPFFLEIERARQEHWDSDGMPIGLRA